MIEEYHLYAYPHMTYCIAHAGNFSGSLTLLVNIVTISTELCCCRCSYCFYYISWHKHLFASFESLLERGLDVVSCAPLRYGYSVRSTALRVGQDLGKVEIFPRKDPVVSVWSESESGADVVVSVARERDKEVVVDVGGAVLVEIGVEDVALAHVATGQQTTVGGITEKC